ncbi:LysR family transcriptional regulator [Methylobacterium brachiatum]|uniref:LysR family transcriptional regulator n=1 Tax=Methylobacterium brachiatum TaxID=269660 RepID=UPI00244B2696|nr:LysR family transcriptional regulator [Methylobacterium brachiatum]MDH2309215.1 LysR family transcriptional regulator [Methylobacterium brachiatum]
MDLRDLAFFEVIADTGHLGRAAERLGRTQPALTKCIQRLEASVGAELFARSSRGLALTQVGDVLLSRARLMRTAMDEAIREVSEFAAGTAGHVRIGTGATMAEYLLPHVCRQLIAAAPGVTVDLQIGMSGVLRMALRESRLDLVIGPVLPSDADEFAHETFGADEVVVVAAKGHPLCGRPLKIEDFSAYNWVLPARTVAMRQWLDTAFQAHGIAGPRVQIETNSITMLPRLIGETELLSFTSTRNLLPERLGSWVERLDIDATTLRRPLGCIHRRDSYLSPAASRVVTWLREQGADLLTEGGPEPFTTIPTKAPQGLMETA